MWRPHASRRQRVAATLCVVSVAVGASCADRADEDAARDDDGAGAGTTTAGIEPTDRDRSGVASGAAAAAELGRVLGRAAGSEGLGDADRSAAEEAMQRVLGPLLGSCEGCRAAVSYVEEPGGGDHFRCELRSSDGAAVADLHVFHRPDLSADAARAWARTELHGHPASVVAGERVFVWPGRFEIRAFARGDGPGGEAGLEDMIGRLPLDALADL